MATILSDCAGTAEALPSAQRHAQILAQRELLPNLLLLMAVSRVSRRGNLYEPLIQEMACTVRVSCALVFLNYVFKSSPQRAGHWHARVASHSLEGQGGSAFVLCSASQLQLELA